MDETRKIEQTANGIRLLVLWRDLWSQEQANIRTVNDLGLDDSRVWITVFQG